MAYKPLLKWYQTQMAADPVVFDLPTLVDAALNHFATDQAFYDWAARPAVYATLQRLVASPRNGGNGRLLKPSSFDQLREHIAEGYKKLMRMNRADLTEAIDERTRRHVSEGRYILFLTALRQGLRTDKEKVRDRFTLDAVKAEYTKHMGLKVKTQPVKKYGTSRTHEGVAVPMAAKSRR